MLIRDQRQDAHICANGQRHCTLRPLLALVVVLMLLRFASTYISRAAVIDQPAPHVLYLPTITRSDPSEQRTSPPVINSFHAEPASINAGEATTLTWQVTDATKVSIEGLGDVTGTTLMVKPITTTVYTMIAANAIASVVAKTTVTVQANSGASVANFFLPYDLYDHIWSNRLPQLVIDSNDVTHVAYAASDSAAFYGYCAANCTSKESFHMVGFGLENLDTAQLAVDPAGRPRLLVSLTVDGVLKYRYAECNSDCATIKQWLWSDDLVEGKIPGSTVEATRSFALDAQGRPRFVHSIWTVNGTDASDYVFCNANCTEAGNWQQVTLGNAFVENLALQLTPSGLARIAYYAKTQDQQANVIYQIGYLECTTLDCSQHIGPLDLVQVSSGTAAFALRLDSTGLPRMALYPGNGQGGELPASRLYYLTCTGNCAQTATNWRALDIGLPATVNGQAVYHGELGLDLALDHQDRPRMAFRIWPYAELGYAWCNQSDCATAAAGWNETLIPSTQAADAELGHIRYSCPTCYPPVADCQSYWDAGWWPALAIGADGMVHVAFEAQLWSYGGACSAQALARFSRLAVFAQP